MHQDTCIINLLLCIALCIKVVEDRGQLTGAGTAHVNAFVHVTVYVCVCVDTYMCIYMIVSRKVIRAHIAFVCTL